MGDISEMMLDGTLCEQCGAYIGKAVDHTRMCAGCKPRPTRPVARKPAPAQRKQARRQRPPAR